MIRRVGASVVYLIEFEMKLIKTCDILPESARIQPAWRFASEGSMSTASSIRFCLHSLMRRKSEAEYEDLHAMQHLDSHSEYANHFSNLGDEIERDEVHRKEPHI